MEIQIKIVGKVPPGVQKFLEGLYDLAMDVLVALGVEGSSISGGVLFPAENKED